MRLIIYSIAGIFLNLLVLMVPLALTGHLADSLADPTVGVFLMLATCFYLGDFSSVIFTGSEFFPAHQDKKNSITTSTNDTTTTGIARCVGLLILSVFWLSLAERAFSIDSGFGWLQITGGLLMFAGVSIRFASIRTLGRFFVTEIKVDDGQPLVQQGIYRFARHPSETGLLAVVVGASLLLSSLVGLVTCLVALLPLVLWRVRREDRCLEAAYGENFRAYTGRVNALLPLVF